MTKEEGIAKKNMARMEEKCRELKMEPKNPKNQDITFNHREMTSQEAYENVKRLHKAYPDIVMDPEKWKKLQLRHLKSEGQSWSK